MRENYEIFLENVEKRWHQELENHENPDILELLPFFYEAAPTVFSEGANYPSGSVEHILYKATHGSDKKECLNELIRTYDTRAIRLYAQVVENADILKCIKVNKELGDVQSARILKGFYSEVKKAFAACEKGTQKTTVAKSKVKATRKQDQGGDGESEQ